MMTNAEIFLDLPMPPSTNRLWRHSRGHVYCTKEYKSWQRACDDLALLNHYCRCKIDGHQISGPFEFSIHLAESGRLGDGDNRIKAVLDWLQRVKIIRDDWDCEKGSWEWVPTAKAPLGCRVFLKPL